MWFRKRPLLVEAWHIPEIIPEVGAQLSSLGCQHSVHYGTPVRIFITTLEGNMELSAGDWLIKGIKGEFYACKPDIFAVTYEHWTLASPDPEAVVPI